jgi:hypothetical protein
MKWNELPLYRAVAEVRREMMECNEQPNSDLILTNEENRTDFCQRVMLKMDFNGSAIIDANIKFRKGSGVNDAGQKKLEIICMLSIIHGDRCFYANRGLGECSDDVHLDRIIPGSRGGEYTVQNCLLSCGFHNTSRGDKSIEEFISHRILTGAAQ